MTISSELFNAILSMDAYNRGYDQSIVMTGNVVGNAHIMTTQNALGENVPLDSSILTTNDQAIGFYALAYDTNNDGVADVISYRGTDFPKEGQNFLLTRCKGESLNKVYHYCKQFIGVKNK